MAVPFRRTSKTKKRLRRTHFKLSVTGLTTCAHCGAMIHSHAICDKCGYYAGKPVIVTEQAKDDAKKNEPKKKVKKETKSEEKTEKKVEPKVETKVEAATEVASETKVKTTKAKKK